MVTRDQRAGSSRAPAPPAARPTESPPVGSVAGELASALELAGYLPIGAPVRLLHGDPARTWTVAGLSVDLHDAANMSLRYRLWCVNPFDFRTVPAALVEPIGSGGPSAPAASPAFAQTDPISGAGPLVWVSPAAGFERTRCGRFEIAHPDGLGAPPVVRDLWTGETAEHVYTRTCAHHWCRHRASVSALNWRPGAGLAAAGPHEYAPGSGGAKFFVYQEAGQVDQWFGVDDRFARAEWRHSPDFRTAAEARAWCEVRAACAARPALVEADPDARDEWGGPLVLQYAPDVAAEIPF